MNRLLALTLVCLATSAYAQEPRAIVALSVSFGDHSGEHRVSSQTDSCDVGDAGPGTWRTRLANPQYEQNKKLNRVTLIVPEARKASGGTSEFLLAVGFGSHGNSSGLYTVDTRQPAAKKGGGTVTIDDRGKTAMIRFSAITQDGVKIDGTIECNSVTRTGT